MKIYRYKHHFSNTQNMKKLFVILLVNLFFFSNVGFSQQLVPIKKEGKFGFGDVYNNIAVEPKYDDVKSSEDFHIVTLNNYYGIVSATGQEIIPPYYEEINVDPVSVLDGFIRVKRGGKSGYVDFNNEIVIPLQHDDIFYVGSKKFCIVKYVNGSFKLGVIDSKGNLIIPLKYDYISRINYGLFRVEQDDKWGLIDETGREIVPVKYDNIHEFSDGLAQVSESEAEILKFADGTQMQNTSYRYGYINKEGELITPIEYEKANSFSEGLAAVFKNGLWGYIDTSGKLVISHKFDDAIDFYQGIAEVRKGQQKFLINKQGELFDIPQKYEVDSRFEDGVVKVYLRSLYSTKYYIDINGKELFTKDNRLIPFEYNGKYGYKNRDDEVVIGPKYEFAYDFVDGVAIVKKDGKYGFLGDLGEEITPIKYNGVKPFENGRALVTVGFNYGLIDYSGKEVIPVSEEYWIQENIGATYIAEKSKKYGLIDRSGKQLTDFKYDRILVKSDHLFSFSIDEKWGLINTRGEEVTPELYTEIEEYSDGLAIVGKDGKYGYIDENGTIIIPVKYNSAFTFSDGLALVKNEDSFFYIDKTGKVVVKANYKKALPFKEGLAPVINHNNKVGFINKKGELIIPFKYDNYYDNVTSNSFLREMISNVNQFSEGLVAVRKEMVKNDKIIAKYGFIDRKGNTVIPFIYDDAESFKNNLSRVILNGREGYIDRKGKEVIPVIYKALNQPESFSEGLVNINNGDKWGYLSRHGETIIPFRYDKAGPFENGMASVEKDGLRYKIDIRERKISP